MFESWTRWDDAPFARVNHQAVFLNGCLYVFGGFNSQLRDITYNLHQLDVFKWNVHHNKWEELKYPLRLKAWDCNTKCWTSDPLSSADGSINPTLRFGHTVVAWRGRGWLFGGRTQQHVCSNQLYMFEPGYYSHSVDLVTTHVTTNEKMRTTTLGIVHPCWAEVVGTTGSAPSPRDGHAATVLENAMFIFGGFEDVFGSYDNLIYRLDFITWSWMRIQIHPHPRGISQLTISGQELQASHSEISPSTVHRSSEASDGHEPSGPTPILFEADVPLPRDFSCLISHQGRIFLFGGRGELAARSGLDVYDSALWELVPLRINESMTSDSQESMTDHNCYTPVWPDQCESCSMDKLRHLSTLGSLERMAWEEETGNWTSPEFWATAPPRPCCLWMIGSSRQRNASKVDCSACHSKRFPLFGCRSRWSSGNATWVRRHPGHGLQSPDHLLPRIFQVATNNAQLISTLVTSASPLGRRSLSHWAYDGHLYISFGTIRCQTSEQWQLHYHDVWRFSLTDNTWTQITTEHAERDFMQISHWPSARRRAVANLYLPCPHISGISSTHVPTKFRPMVYVFGGTQPRVLEKRYSTATCRGSRHLGVTAPARPYTLFTSGIPSVSTTAEPVTQNRLLGLGDGDSVSLLNFPSTTTSTTTTITSPMAILLVNSPRTFHTERSTPFYLVMVVPAHLPVSYFSCPRSQPCLHHSALSHLCVVSFAELGALFRTPSTNSLPLDTMCYGALDKLLYTSEPDLQVDQIQLYTALRLAWFAVLNRSHSSGAPSSSADVIGGSRLHMLIVQQQEQPLSTESADGDTFGHSRMETSDSLNEFSTTPLILEQHSYILAPDGQVLRESLDCVQGFLWFTLLPLVCSALITTVDLLLESTRRLLTCLRQGNLRSFVLGPLVFRSTAPCPDCSAVDQRPVHVWIDSSQLTGLIPVHELSGTASTARSSSRGSWDCRHQTIASLLIQFLPHLRSTLELEFATQHLAGDSVPRITEPLNHIPSSTAGNSGSGTTVVPLEVASTSTLNEISTACSSVGPSLSSVEDSCSVTSPSTFLRIVDQVPSSVPVPAAQQEPVIQHADDAGSSDSEGIGEFFEHYFTGDDEPHTSDSDDSSGTAGNSVIVMHQIGALVRGHERLMELSDCYVMHLDTTLYDLCLRRLRGLNPSRLVLLTLPTEILHDLKRLYHNPLVSDRKSTSG